MICFPDFLFVILTAPTRRLKIASLERKAYPSLQATCCHRGDASAQRAAPGRAELFGVALRRGRFRRNSCHLSIYVACECCAHEPTLTGANSTSNKFSQTPRANHNHQHISKNKLTSGYRKRLSGSRAIKQNVKKIPDFLFVILAASTPRLKNSIA